MKNSILLLTILILIISFICLYLHYNSSQIGLIISSSAITLGIVNLCDILKAKSNNE